MPFIPLHNISIVLNKGYTWFSIPLRLDDTSFNNVLMSKLIITNGDVIYNMRGIKSYYEGYGWFGHGLQNNILPTKSYVIKLAMSQTLHIYQKPAFSFPFVYVVKWIGIHFVSNPYRESVPFDMAIPTFNYTTNDRIMQRTFNRIGIMSYYKGYGWFGYNMRYLIPGAGLLYRLQNTGNLTYNTISTEKQQSRLLYNKRSRLLSNSLLGVCCENREWAKNVADFDADKVKCLQGDTGYDTIGRDKASMFGAGQWGNTYIYTNVHMPVFIFSGNEFISMIPDWHVIPPVSAMPFTLLDNTDLTPAQNITIGVQFYGYNCTTMTMTQQLAALETQSEDGGNAWILNWQSPSLPPPKPPGGPSKPPPPSSPPVPPTGCA
jgi:hypothetical protein